MRVKLTETEILLQPESPQDLIEICSMMGDGMQRKLRVDREAAAAVFTGKPLVAVDPTAPAPDRVSKPAAPATVAPIEGADRKAIRAELDALGIEYNNRLGTEKLAALLADSRAKAAPVSVPQASTPAADPGSVFGDPDPLAESAPAVTKDDVMAALKSVIAAKGKEEGTPIVKNILGSVGAANISGIDPKDYAGIIEQAKKVS